MSSKIRAPCTDVALQIRLNSCINNLFMYKCRYTYIDTGSVIFFFFLMVEVEITLVVLRAYGEENVGIHIYLKDFFVWVERSDGFEPSVANNIVIITIYHDVLNGCNNNSTKMK